MNYIFSNAGSFNGDLSKWDVSSVVNMHSMFSNLAAFSADLSTWDVSSVTDMAFMFEGATAFNSDLSRWDVSSLMDMSHMFEGAAAFNADISKWDVSSVTQIWSMFKGATSFSGDLSKWDVSGVMQMSDMFEDATSFNADLSKWDMSKLTKAGFMFKGATVFNGDISTWDMSRVTNMGAMLMSAISFNGDISKWDVSRVLGMSSIFQNATLFNSDLSKWDVSGVVKMGNMFKSASLFNGDLSKWRVSSATNMRSMFEGATSFKGDISKWEVSGVIDMAFMFKNATSFVGDLSKWDVSSVMDMRHMFSGAVAFNGDISKWDVSRATNMRSTFEGATSFNGGISRWDVSSVKNMRHLFFGATSFSQALCGAAWVNSQAAKTNMFVGSSGSISTVCASVSIVCSKCTSTRAGELSCCAPGGSWFKNCGKPGDSRFDYTWEDGVNACQKKVKISAVSTIANPAACSKCAASKSGKLTCCTRGGSWFQKCGNLGDSNFDHTWIDGIQACTMTSPTVGMRTVTRAPVTCPKCVVNKVGTVTCCTRGGSWFQKCGNLGDSRFDHTFSEGIQACATKPTVGVAIANTIKCRKCASNKAGKRTCCARGGSWFQKCGNAGDSRFDHTWTEGIQVCDGSASGEVQEQDVQVNGTIVAPEDSDMVTDTANVAFETRSGNSKGYLTRWIIFVLFILLMGIQIV